MCCTTNRVELFAVSWMAQSSSTSKDNVPYSSLSGRKPELLNFAAEAKD